MLRLTLVVSISLAIASAPPGVARGQSGTPVLVELFTSEGCSSCPPADTFLQRLIDSQPLPEVQVIGLGHHVTYWDHQGWRDRFSSEGLTGRQQTYGSALRVENVYTPQMVVDGRSEFNGSDTKAARAAIERAARFAHGTIQVAVAMSSTSRVAVEVTATGLPNDSRAGRADIVLAVTEDGLRSNVRSGENSGKTLYHAAVVRRLSTIGEAMTGSANARSEFALDREWQRDRVKIVVFVQDRSTRHILASGVAALADAR